MQWMNGEWRWLMKRTPQVEAWDPSWQSSNDANECNRLYSFHNADHRMAMRTRWWLLWRQWYPPTVLYPSPPPPSSPSFCHTSFAAVTRLRYTRLIWLDTLQMCSISWSDPMRKEGAYRLPGWWNSWKRAGSWRPPRGALCASQTKGERDYNNAAAVWRILR